MPPDILCKKFHCKFGSKRWNHFLFMLRLYTYNIANSFQVFYGKKQQNMIRYYLLIRTFSYHRHHRLILPFLFVLAGSLHEFLCVFLRGLDVSKSSTPSKNGSLCYVGDEGQNRSQTKRY